MRLFSLEVPGVTGTRQPPPPHPHTPHPGQRPPPGPLREPSPATTSSSGAPDKPQAPTPTDSPAPSSRANPPNISRVPSIRKASGNRDASLSLVLFPTELAAGDLQLQSLSPDLTFGSAALPTTSQPPNSEPAQDPALHPLKRSPRSRRTLLPPEGPPAGLPLAH